MPPTAPKGSDLFAPPVSLEDSQQRRVVLRLRRARICLVSWTLTEDDFIPSPAAKEAAAKSWDDWYGMLTDGGSASSAAGYTALCLMRDRLEVSVQEAEERWNACLDNGPDFSSTLSRALGTPLTDAETASEAREQKRWEEHQAELGRTVTYLSGRTRALGVFLNLFEEDGVSGVWGDLWSETMQVGTPAEGAKPRPAGVSKDQHERVLKIAAALALIEASGPADFDGTNGAFTAWAGEVIGRSASTAEGVLRAAGIMNGEGKSGAAGKGLLSRLRKLRDYGRRYGIENPAGI